MAGQRIADRLAGAADIVEDAGRDAGIRVDARQLVAGKGRGRGRFVDDGVAGQQRAGGHADTQCVWEVERSQDRPDAEWAQHRAIALSRVERVELPHESVVFFHLRRVGIDDVGRFLDLADGLDAVLAGLEDEQRRQAELLFADQRRGAAHDRDRSCQGRCDHAGKAALAAATASLTSAACRRNGQ